MLHQSNRFHGQASVRRTLSQGKAVHGGMLGLKYVRNDRRRSYRVAVVVSRKVSKSAVVRNRIRRRIYEHVRILSISITGPYDIVIGVYDSRLAALPAATVGQDVTRLLTRAGCISGAAPSRAIVIPKET